MTTLPAIDPLWRQPPAATNDLLLLQRHLGFAITNASLTVIIEAMNSTAELLPAGVAMIQAMIDEITALEEAYADEVDAGTAHQGSLKEYEGPIQGATISSDDRRTDLGPLKFDTSLLKERKIFSDGASPQGERLKRRAYLVGQIRQALNLRSPSIGATLIRS